MAEVQFLGIGQSTGFDNRSITQTPFVAPPATAEVENFGVTRNVDPDGPLDVTVQFFTGMATAPREVDYDVSPPPAPLSEDPDDVAYMVHPTGGSNSVTQMSLVNAADDRPPNLNAIAGVNGLVGKTFRFIAPTGATSITPVLEGVSRRIASHSDVLISFATGLSTVPSTTDRGFILEQDRLLRRSPVVEIILS